MSSSSTYHISPALRVEYSRVDGRRAAISVGIKARVINLRLTSVRAIAHPGDGLGLGEPGARFQAADAVYNTRRHSQYLVSAVAVAFWNSSYRSATDKVRDVPPRPRPRSP